MLGPGESKTVPYPAELPEGIERFWRISLGSRRRPSFRSMPDLSFSVFRTGIRSGPSPAALRETEKPVLPLLESPEVVLDRAETDNDRGCKFDLRTHTRKPEDFRTSLVWKTNGMETVAEIGFIPEKYCPEIARFGLRLLLPESAVRRWTGTDAVRTKLIATASARLWSAATGSIRRRSARRTRGRRRTGSGSMSARSG